MASSLFLLMTGQHAHTSFLSFRSSLLRVSVGVLALPVPAVANHIVNGAVGLPPQLAEGFGGIAVAGSDVASTARLDAIGYIDMVDTDEGINHIED